MRNAYRILASELTLLPDYVIEQADVSDTRSAERLLGQIAALQLHSHRQPHGDSLLFRPTPATADLAARAILALRRAQRGQAEIPAPETGPAIAHREAQLRAEGPAS